MEDVKKWASRSSGDGDGSGSGRGYGYGYGSGYGVKYVNGCELFDIDNTPTGIYRCHGNAAKGFVLICFTPVPCYIVKDGNVFAHGNTLREAEDALRAKIFENMDEDEAIERFQEHFKPGVKYKNSEFFEWHHYLTGSCRMGRETFCRNNGVDMDGESTPEYFIELTKDAYGGEVIKKLKEYYHWLKGEQNEQIH